MNTQTSVASDNIPAPQPAAIRIFGIGTAGVNVLEQIIASGVPAAHCIGINTGADSLAACPAALKLPLENQLLRGLGTGGDPERGRAGAQANELRIREACEGAKIIFVVAGLGGGTGTGVAPVVVQAAKQAGALVLTFAILPFECEGSLRAEIAVRGLQELDAASDLVITLPNQKALSVISEATSLVETFKTSNQIVSESIGSAFRMFCGQSVMGLPLRDLCVLITTRSAAVQFASGQASGPGRAQEALERALAGPMLGGLDSLQASRTIAVCVSGGPGLTMLEVNRIMDQVQRACEGVPAVMGAVIDELAGDNLTVALLVATAAAPQPQPAGVQDLSPRISPPGALEKHLLSQDTATRPQSRFVPPAPSLPQEKMEQILARQSPGRTRKTGPKLRQAQLPLEIISRGRFDKSEPTIHKGEDLDVPTYIRRGLVLN